MIDYVESRVYSALASSSSIRLICGDNVFPLQIPQGTCLPAITYQRVSTLPHSTLRGYTSENARVQVNSYTLTYLQSKELAKAVREAMGGTTLRAEFQSEQDFINPGGDVYVVTADFLCLQKGGVCNGR